jgi:hypothetical protein
MSPRRPGTARQTATELSLLNVRIRELQEQFGNEPHPIKDQLETLAREIRKTTRMYLEFEVTGPDCQIDRR